VAGVAESGQRHGCGEEVPGAAGGRRPSVGSPSQLGAPSHTHIGG